MAIEHSPQGQAPHAILEEVPQDAKAQSQVGSLPPDVQQFFDDAHRVLDAGVPDAAAVQLRKTLEAAAAHFNVREQSLVASIKELIERGLVTKGFGDVLHHVRKLGNVGAHASDETVDEQGARRALRFTTQILRNLFEIPAELDADPSAIASNGEDDDEDV